ncbi:PspC domain-containing protein [Paenibacillus sp. NFR01]|uniref:PspC domain-containing protein n=1 Tax=Paenibacillus sp. NFR01 TaxID=1566279 RepID=UPI0008C3601B|nr:PspC domain-containing protein [Paenibacillus sp. NFR01]SEU20787.1 phage shock protein C (PspC) family protein [Paenibacillus sp. NFR01]
MTRLYRSTRDRLMTGLAGGLAETLGIDSTLFRILLVITIPFSGGATILAYFIAALIIPKEPVHYDPFGPGPMAGGPYGGPHYAGPEYGRGPQGHHGHTRHGHHAHGPQAQGGYGPQGGPAYDKAYSAQDSGLDAMMKDIEKKALQKEVEELKRELAKYKKGEV